MYRLTGFANFVDKRKDHLGYELKAKQLLAERDLHRLTSIDIVWEIMYLSEGVCPQYKDEGFQERIQALESMTCN